MKKELHEHTPSGVRFTKVFDWYTNDQGFTLLSQSVRFRSSETACGVSGSRLTRSNCPSLGFLRTPSSDSNLKFDFPELWG
jgi:hypothetical protein